MKVLVVLPLNDAQKARLEAGAPDATYIYSAKTQTESRVNTPLFFSEYASEADVIVGNVIPATLKDCKNLKFLQLNSAGYDQYAKPGIMPVGAKLAGASGAYGQAVSEHLLAMVLSQIKRLPQYHTDQLNHVWSDHGPVTSIRGAHVLVLGAGDIGSHFAEQASALGAHVDGVRHSAGSVPGFENVYAIDSLFEILPAYDIVASFLPSTDETRGLANNDFFAAMKPGAYFANGGRGDLVDQDALSAALESGHLAGASLDVMVPEPLDETNPLWDAPNCLITPHISGGFHLGVVLDNICDIAAENIAHLIAGEPLRNNVEL